MTRQAEPFDDTMPLETRVEQMPIRLAHGAQPMSLDIRLLMGRYWLKLVAPLAPAAAAEYIAAYPVDSPDPQQPDAAPIVAHPEAWAAVAAVAGRAMDGAKLYAHLKTARSAVRRTGSRSLAGTKAQADALGARFVAWFDRLFAQPSGPDAWLPDRLEYQFSCSAADGEHEKVLVADEYSRGQIDWYQLDVDRDARAARRRGDAAGRGDSARTLLDGSGARNLRRHAAFTLVDVRRGPDQLRRDQAGHDGPRQAAADRVRARLRKRLAHRALRRSSWNRGDDSRHGRDERLRRPDLDRSRGRAETTTNGSAGRCS